MFTKEDVDRSSRLQELFKTYSFNLRDDNGNYKPIEEVLNFVVKHFTIKEMQQFTDIMGGASGTSI